ncbi:MAG TPA: iron ABC transporter permease [Euzebyales bacterium]|nr:iron ABC transporter permease [Euzebyales bacterium]
MTTTTPGPTRTRGDRAGADPARRAVGVVPSRLRVGWLVAGSVALAAACLAGVALGPVDLPAVQIARLLLDRLPFVELSSTLSAREAAIVWQLRLPRVVLGGLVGAMLATAGAGYQGVFRNPLADPYLLGIAAGAGVGATLVFAYGQGATGWFIDPLPLAAFAGGLAGVAATYLLSRSVSGRRDTVSLILAGVAVTAFFTAVQTFVQQREADSLRRVYSWLLGHLATTGWHEVRVIAPYVVAAAVVLLAHRRLLDVLSVGDREAVALGVSTARVRLTVVIAASLGTAAAVAVSGLIGFVGIIVPHTVRLLTGSSYRSVLPLSLLFGAAFLILADLLSRTLLAPAEIPIGVVTAFVGAPFFAWVLRHRRLR